MTTATPTRPLEEEIAERARTFMDAETLPDQLEDGIRYLVDGFIGAYAVYDDPMGDHMAAPWMLGTENALTAAAMAEIRRSVVPVMAATLTAHLRQNPPPSHLPAHEESEQLRADLASLEADR